MKRTKAALFLLVLILLSSLLVSCGGEKEAATDYRVEIDRSHKNYDLVKIYPQFAEHGVAEFTDFKVRVRVYYIDGTTKTEKFSIKARNQENDLAVEPYISRPYPHSQRVKDCEVLKVEGRIDKNQGPDLLAAILISLGFGVLLFLALIVNSFIENPIVLILWYVIYVILIVYAFIAWSFLHGLVFLIGGIISNVFLGSVVDSL